MSDMQRGLDDEPHDDRPVYGERRRRALRITVLVALGALLLPLMLSTYGVARSAATRACVVYVDRFDAEAAGFQVTFELLAAGGPGWQCAAVSAGGVTTVLANLGMLPAAPRPITPDERGT